MTNLINKILDLIYPKGLVCISCGKELTDDEREYSLCIKCFSTLKEITDEMKICDNISVLSCFRYDTVARNIVLSYKDSDKPFMSEYIAMFLAKKYNENKLNVDGIVYVPSNKKKINKRGYDALKYVATHLSLFLGIPVLCGLEKKNIGKDLTKVAKEYREAQVKDTFYIDNDIQLKNSNILLIDDVITTGATLKECINTLKKAEVSNITVITFTRALH